MVALQEMQEGTVSEKDAQADYESSMAHAGKKRAADSKLITEKETAKAEGEEALQNENERKKMKKKTQRQIALYRQTLYRQIKYHVKML